MNELIEKTLKNFTVNGKKIPVSFLRYDGKETTYVTYMQTDAESDLYTDDDLRYYTVYYDFDIYSKGNYKPIEKALKAQLQAVGFQWQMGRDSADLYEDDTQYFHKTVCMSYWKGETDG